MLPLALDTRSLGVGLLKYLRHARSAYPTENRLKPAFQLQAIYLIRLKARYIIPKFTQSLQSSLELVSLRHAPWRCKFRPTTQCRNDISSLGLFSHTIKLRPWWISTP
jgi:hypothetical protein